MAMLVDPYTGEMFFKGGRYDISDQIDLDAVRQDPTVNPTVNWGAAAPR
jgi:hypothetical protein